VIGVPIKTSALNGLDSLLSIVQMPAGVPVATVAIDNARNAAILAVSILGVKYPEIAQKLRAYKDRMRKEVTDKAERLERMNYKEYLQQMG
jgi:5-(carboxyamino)imidazole ribonucleotide mutase